MSISVLGIYVADLVFFGKKIPEDSEGNIVILCMSADVNGKNKQHIERFLVLTAQWKISLNSFLSSYFSLHSSNLYIYFEYRRYI